MNFIASYVRDLYSLICSMSQIYMLSEMCIKRCQYARLLGSEGFRGLKGTFFLQCE